MRRSLLVLTLSSIAILAIACSSPTASKSPLRPGVRSTDVGMDSVAVSVTVCASGWQNSSGRCL